ncbi:uncharacterized protein UBRO_20779 [Ustilago bromivora]|uniref:Uncharacterized protein n=1 Tax=Ustilago bromivora TaxID=307758 RepID=A0A1K0GTG5_9BASI|nr:uncharacterized protein UBRO_20779 [Ustilago bromivora]
MVIWETSLCNAFQPDASEIQCLAGECKWEWTKESITSYFYTKLSLLHAAFPTCQGTDLLNEIRYGFPVSLQLDVRTHLLTKPNMDDLLTGLCNLEGPWKATLHSGSCYNLHNDLLPQPPTLSITFSTPNPPMSSTVNSPCDKATLPHMDSRAPTKYRLAANYSLANISYIKKDGRSVWTYQLPNSRQTITLGRLCRSCSQDHFDFEHDFLSHQPKMEAHIIQAKLDLTRAYGYSTTCLEPVCTYNEYTISLDALVELSSSQNQTGPNPSIHDTDATSCHVLPFQRGDRTAMSRN